MNDTESNGLVSDKLPKWESVTAKLSQLLPISHLSGEHETKNILNMSSKNAMTDLHFERLSYPNFNLYKVSAFRSQTLSNFDKLLGWIFNPQRYAFILQTPLKTETFHITHANILHFSTQYGYFSYHHPLIAKVTDDYFDLLLTAQLLEDIHHAITKNDQRKLLTDEVLAKVLAYRDMQKGQEISIPCPENQLVTFVVDELFDLGQGMPAFGLIPKTQKKEAVPILLFRGTDLSILSKRSLASIISDLDPKGPGLTHFLKSQESIHRWLDRVAHTHTKARLIGFSLGGALAIYTYLYEHELINHHPLETSSIFNPPGVSKKIYRQWETLDLNSQTPIDVFVTRGDMIPKIGKLVGNVSQLSIDHSLLPIAAHVTLVSATPIYYQNAVNLKLENQSNRFSR